MAVSSPTVFDYFQPDSPVGTEFLRLYHHLARPNAEPKSTQSFLITSATMGEGKSTVASFLALTLGTIKQKTLLIDCDLRRPKLHKLFGLYVEDGVTDVADGRLPLARAFKETRLPNLHVLTAGRLSNHPGTYVEDGHLGRILDQAKARFDFILIDCAPIMPVVDPVVLAKDTSGVLLVVKAGVTHRDLVKQAVDALKRAHAPIAGVLLNNVRNVLPYHYAYRYAYEYYREPVKSKE